MSAAALTVNDTASTRVSPASWAAVADSCGRAVMLAWVITSTGSCVTVVWSAKQHTYTDVMVTFHVNLDSQWLVDPEEWLVQHFCGWMPFLTPTMVGGENHWTSSFLDSLTVRGRNVVPFTSALQDPKYRCCRSADKTLEFFYVRSKQTWFLHQLLKPSTAAYICMATVTSLGVSS